VRYTRGSRHVFLGLLGRLGVSIVPLLYRWMAAVSESTTWISRLACSRIRNRCVQFVIRREECQCRSGGMSIGSGDS